MQKPHQFNCNAGFLPSVKVRPLNKSKNKKPFIDSVGLYLRPKLKINQPHKQVPELIQDYYRRFKLQSQKGEPLSVSINFKQFSQDQLESRKAQVSQKIRSKSSKNKNRAYSESSYTEQLHRKKAVLAEKISYSAKILLSRLKCLPIRNGICQQESIIKNHDQHIQQLIRDDKVPETKIHNQKFMDSIQTTMEPLQKTNMPALRGKLEKSRRICQKTKNTQYSSLMGTKKNKSKFRSWQGGDLNVNEGNFQSLDHELMRIAQRKITPWKDEDQVPYENNQEEIELLERSVECANLL